MPRVGRVMGTAFLLAVLATPAKGQSPAGPSDQPVGKVLDISGKVLDIVGLESEVKGIDLGIPGSSVALTSQEIRIELPADILFDFDKADIRPSAATALHKVAEIIKDKGRGHSVRIDGYTDSRGNAAYNQKLSEQRAESVKQWLMQKEGLNNLTFTTRGFGASKPVAPNTKPDGSDDPAGRQKNRRVEITIKTG